jgi:hypothetical protein
MLLSMQCAVNVVQGQSFSDKRGGKYTFTETADVDIMIGRTWGDEVAARVQHNDFPGILREREREIFV